MFNDFDNPMGDFYAESSGLGMDYGMGYGMDYGMGYGRYKPIKATTRNVQDVIAMQLGCDPYALQFVKLDEPPAMQNWKHSCYFSGVTKMNPVQFIFDDGSTVIYATCPFFPQCNKVHYFVDRGY